MPPAKKETNWKAWGIGGLAALVLVICLQNSQQVRVDVLFLTLDAPLIVILLIAVAVGARSATRPRSCAATTAPSAAAASSRDPVTK